MITKIITEQKWNKDSNTPRDYSKEYNAPGSKEQDERNKRKRDKRKHDKEHGECPEGEELHHVDGVEGEDLRCEPMSKNRGRKEKSRLKKGEVVIKIKRTKNEGSGRSIRAEQKLQQIIKEEILKEVGWAYSEPGIAAKVAKGAEELKNMDISSAAGHTILDIAGIIPLFGEVFDITNAIWYAREKEYLQAAFSAISIIPTVGDMIGKTGKLLLVAYSLGKSGIWKAAIPLVKVIQQNKSLIAKIFKKIADHPQLAASYLAMEKALAKFVENTYIEPEARDSLRRTQEVFVDLKKTVGLKIAYQKAGMTSPEAPMSVETPEDEETL